MKIFSGLMLTILALVSFFQIMYGMTINPTTIFQQLVSYIEIGFGVLTLAVIFVGSLIEGAIHKLTQAVSKERNVLKLDPVMHHMRVAS